MIENPEVAAVTKNREVTISYTGVAQEQMVAGDYGDTITFTISAN
jgi:spore coat protein U-like protein